MNRAYFGTMGLALAAALAGCGTNGSAPRAVGAVRAGATLAPAHAPAYAGPNAIPESSPARARIDELRARFLVTSAGAYDPPPGFPQSSAAPAPVLGASVATGFELRGSDVLPVIPAAAKQSAGRTATVMLPEHAGGPVKLSDDRSHVAVSFTLQGTSQAGVTTAGGIAMYPGALAGADVLYRTRAEGTEDYIVFEQRPAIEEIAYSVDVSRAPGLRFVGNTLEFLDRGGVPRLRLAAPYVVDANGHKTQGALALQGCAFDANPRAPWGHQVTVPGASHCTVSITWKAAAYPAIVDPSWTATGSMTNVREYQTATVLGSGDVLITGGDDGSGTGLASAELYDPSAGTFAATGTMTASRYFHTATLLGSGQVLVVGGLDSGGNAQTTAELYDPTGGTFTATGSMTTAYAYQSATLLASGQVLIAAGYNTDVISDAGLYDSTGATYTATGSLVTGRVFQTATLLSSGQVLVAGGSDTSGNSLASAEIYDPTGATFSATGSMAAARTQHSATLLGSGDVLVAGGYDTSGNALSSAELYDPTSTTFAATGSLTTARGVQTSTLLSTGEILIAGGNDSSENALSSVEIYDSDGATFATTGPMTNARAFFTATLLGSGDVLAAGGSGSSGVESSAELFSASLSTDASTYSVGNPITVSWAGLPGNPTDFITLAPLGSSVTTVTTWNYTGGAVAGSNTFASGISTAGTYVARAFSDGTWNKLQESAPFTVTPPSGTVTTDASSYYTGNPITVSWTGLPGNPTDFVTLAPQGSALTTVTTWNYTGGTVSGSNTFLYGVSATGTYVARAFSDGTWNLIDESAPFTVTIAPTVTTDQSSYGPSDNITVTWTGLPGNPTDFITLAPQGSPLTTVTTWNYTGGAMSGSNTFVSGISTPGTYVARAFLDSTWTLAGESAVFTVNSPAANVTTDMPAYGPGQAITVTWSGMPGDTNDWIAIAPQGAAPGTVTVWAYTGGTASGSYTFTDGISTTGTYVATAYVNGTYSIGGQSAAFTVNASAATIITDQSSYTEGQDITVTWTGTPGNTNDWISIAPQGSAYSTVTLWVYTDGVMSGSNTFVGGITTSGTYVARAFSNGTYSLLVESTPFTVD